MLFIIILLALYGSLMIFSASTAYAEIRFSDSYYFVRRQALWAALGMLSMLLSLVYFTYVIIVTFMGEGVEVGCPSVIGTILALGGVQLFIIGIGGIYLGKFSWR